MNGEIKEISDKLDRMRQEYIRDKYESLGYILWGFTLAMVSLTVANPDPANIAASIVFFIMGYIAMVHSRRVKAKQDAGKQMTIGGKRRLILLARWFEWVFATVLMTAITVIVSLQYLSGCGRVVLLIGLGIFLVATVISQFDQAGWFGRRGGG